MWLQTYAEYGCKCTLNKMRKYALNNGCRCTLNLMVRVHAALRGDAAVFGDN